MKLLEIHLNEGIAAMFIEGFAEAKEVGDVRKFALGRAATIRY